MKRTIVKFGAAALLMGMFAMIPACKSEQPAEEATETVDAATEEAAVTTDSTQTGESEEDSTKVIKQPG